MLKHMFLRPLAAFLILLCLAHSAAAQKDYRVDDFSPAYFGKIHLDDTTQVFSAGWVAIYSKKTQKQVLKVESEELALELHEGKVQSNIQQLPYGEQSLIISRDFNFDGRPDLAIEDGQNSCYHGPSFQVYLDSAGTLVLSPDFTRLAQEYCGMFSTDAKTKRLSVMTKSGCCWHEYSEFVVRRNAPFLVKRVEEDAMRFPLTQHTEEVWNGTRMLTTTKDYVELEDNVEIVCAFRLAENGKRVVLFAYDKTTLYYALLRPDNSAEFVFQSSETDDKPFVVRKAGSVTTLRFRNGPAIYAIQEAADGKMRVSVQSGTKARELTGAPGTKKGSLRGLLTAKLENVTHQP